MSKFDIIPCQPNTPEWLQLRKQGIGGSDAPGILGESKYENATPYQIYLEKLGLTDSKVIEDYQRRGHILEPAVLQWYREESKYDAQPVQAIYRSKEFPWMQFTPDADIEGHDINVQVKTSRLYSAWGDEHTDEIPLEIIIQSQHEMVVTGDPVTHIPVLLPSLEFRLFVVEADDAIQQSIIQAEHDFWHLNILQCVEPDATSSEDINIKFRSAHGGIAKIFAMTDIVKWEELKSCRERKKFYEGREEELKNHFKLIMGENSTLENEGGTKLATWNASKPGQKFDMDTFKKVYPAIYDRFLVDKPSHRTFLIK